MLDGLDRTAGRSEPVSAVRQVILGGGHAFAIKVAGAAFAFLAQVFLARWLGATEFGVYTYALAWAQIAMLLGRLGLDTASLRFVGKLLGEGDLATLARFVDRSRVLVFMGALGVSIIVLAAVLVWPGVDSSSLRRALFVAAALVPIGALVQLRGSVLRGFGSITAAMVPMEVGRPAMMLAGLALVAGSFVAWPRSAAGGLAIYLIVSACVLCLMEWFQRRRFKPTLESRATRKETRIWLAVSIPMLLMSGMHLVLGRTDLLMIGSWLGPERVGIYGAVGRTSILVVFCVTAVNSIAAPIIARLYARGEIAELGRMLSGATVAISAISIPASLGLILFRSWILGWFGSEFVAGADVLLVFAIAQLINSPFGMAGFATTMTGNERFAAWTLTVAALVNVGLNVVLIHSHGIVGAAIATGTSRLLWNLTLAWKVQKELGINWFKIATGYYLRSERPH